MSRARSSARIGSGSTATGGAPASLPARALTAAGVAGFPSTWGSVAIHVSTVGHSGARDLGR